MFKVEIIKQACAVDAEQLDKLLNELTDKRKPFDYEALKKIVSMSGLRLFVARNEDNRIIGTLTLAHYSTPSTEKFWIEDVVTDSSARGQGVGRALVSAAIETAQKIEPQAKLYLTSNPSRKVARALYRTLGFEEYPTSVFRKL